MFDPTVFDNLKVAFENTIYDLNNLDRRIAVTSRKDVLDMAVMGRRFSIGFQLTDGGTAYAEIELSASLKELAAELLEQEGTNPGCELNVYFHVSMDEIDENCRQIREALHEIWEPEQPVSQTIGFIYGSTPLVYRNRIGIPFNRKINEDQMEDIANLVDFTIKTLERLRAMGW
ncbi:hypothetical protein ACFSL6_15285 [Paenibacillus thailandensis]|uniref:Uncharacterized protein n=1 Tax=Paenibacillus thailandensis TaxID=393250 RepID=A0ABW5R4E7_9BACL